MQQKAEILLKYFRKGVSQREISRKLGISRDTVRKYINEFEKKLQKLENKSDKKKILLLIEEIVSKPKNDELKENQLNDLKLVFDNKPIIEKIYNYIQEFRIIFKNKDLERFKNWIKETSESGIKELERFCISIIKDFDSVINPFKYEYSNGLLEGQINRLKMIKRQMYGRANFDLLRKKVLYVG